MADPLERNLWTEPCADSHGMKPACKLQSERGRTPVRAKSHSIFLVFLIAFLPSAPASPAGERPAIETVEIQPNRAVDVNGKPFFPIMAWLQDPANFLAIRSCGMNTVAGYWRKSGGTRDVKEYLDIVERAGLYGVMPFDKRLKGHPALLGYIHDDEPDLPRLISDAVVEPAENLTINSGTPFWKLVDGDPDSWTVLDPLEGASVTVKLKEPVTVESLALWLTISKGLAVAREISFEADGRRILAAKVAEKKGRQKFDLPEAVTLRGLTLRILSVRPGEHSWGSVGEIEAFDREGKNVLVSPPRTLPRVNPGGALERYRAIKESDASRPVFMTLTGYFHPFFGKYNNRQRRMYPDYIKATDIIGFDIYPIYGWNKPQWIHLVHEGSDLLVKMAGAKPVYAWIETSKGSQWTGELSQQKDVTPSHIRAEVWMAICRGATAIGYFTHIWKPSYSQFGVPEVNREAITRINSQVTRLAPAILGEKPDRAVSIRGGQAVKLDALAKRLNGDLYIFAVNYDERLRKASATVTVGGLRAGAKVVVVDEKRAITSEEGLFAGEFEPLAVHIYRVGISRAKHIHL